MYIEVKKILKNGKTEDKPLICTTAIDLTTKYLRLIGFRGKFQIETEEDVALPSVIQIEILWNLFQNLLTKGLLSIII